MWKKAARGTGEPPRRRSTASEAIPCCARNMAVERPTKPPPAKRTGTSESTAGIQSLAHMKISRYLPPATSMNEPVVKTASSDSSHRMARATSSAVPPRFIGTNAFTRSTRFGSPPLACISV